MIVRLVHGVHGGISWKQENAQQPCVGEEALLLSSNTLMTKPGFIMCIGSACRIVEAGYSSIHYLVQRSFPYAHDVP